jgi:colanic acid biosynthesis glycosyl transferase WcaI
MKFTILSQYYPPEVGAPQARLSELAAAFVRRGHEVTVLTALPNYPIGRIFDGYPRVCGREMHGPVKVIRTFVYATQSASMIRRLTNYLSFLISSSVSGAFLLGPSDYLLVESPPLFLGLAAVWLSWLKGARLIFNVSDLWPDSAVDLGVLRRDSIAYRISAKLEAFFYRHAWLVTCQSKSILANIATRFPDSPLFHLSNAVDTKRFKPDCRTVIARNKLSSNGGCVALYAGLHGLAQGLDQVLATAEVLRDEQIKFVLIGDGPEKKRLMQQAHERSIDNVVFLDLSPAVEVPALLASADLALVTLRTYIPGAVPSKLYEAMSSGVPVVLVADGEAADIVREHDAGIAVKPGDIQAFVDAVQSLLDKPALRRSLGSNGRKAAEKYFDRSAMANGFIDHLERNLIATRSNM